MLIISAAEHPDYPVRADIIRMDVFDFTLLSEEGGDLKMQKFQSFDIKGWFPVRLLNMLVGAH